jgi:hypothetical protein
MNLRLNPVPLLIGLACFALPSCSTSVLKPDAAKMSPFLSSSVALIPARETSPFAMAGGMPKTEAKSLYIAPISLEYLRDPTKRLARMSEKTNRPEAAKKLAEYGQQAFGKAFKSSPNAVYAVDSVAKPKGATLKLAITELNRNTIVGALGRLAPNASGVPGLGPALSLSGATRPLKGSIAIEGKLIENRTGKVVYQFADIAESKQALIPITDFAAYGQARQAMRDWGRLFEKVTRAAPNERVKGVLPISLY